MPSRLSDLAEIVGLILIAVAVGALAGIWWGAGAAGVELVIYAQGASSGDGPPPPGAA